jgi:hypothetical protein
MDSRAYIGQWSADGQFFVAAFQDKRVRLYDTTHRGTSAAATSSSDGGGGYGRSGSYSGGGSFSASDSYRSGSFGGSGGGAGAGAGQAAAAAAAAADRRPAAHQAGGWRLRKDVTTRMTRWTITGESSDAAAARRRRCRTGLFGGPLFDLFSINQRWPTNHQQYTPRPQTPPSAPTTVSSYTPPSPPWRTWCTWGGRWTWWVAGGGWMGDGRRVTLS